MLRLDSTSLLKPAVPQFPHQYQEVPMILDLRLIKIAHEKDWEQGPIYGKVLFS
jgi:hypothetical protein